MSDIECDAVKPLHPVQNGWCHTTYNPVHMKELPPVSSFHHFTTTCISLFISHCLLMLWKLFSKMELERERERETITGNLQIVISFWSGGIFLCSAFAHFLHESADIGGKSTSFFTPNPDWTFTLHICFPCICDNHIKPLFLHFFPSASSFPYALYLCLSDFYPCFPRGHGSVHLLAFV